MAYRELFVLVVKEVLRLWVLGHGYRAVARSAGVDRKTARRYVEAAQALGLSRGGGSRVLDDALLAEVVRAVHPGAPSAAGPMREHCQAHVSLIEGWVEQGCRGPKVVKLLARHTGVVVPLRTLQRFIEEEVRPRGREADTVRVADPDPGQVVEVDFLELGWFEERGTGRRRKMHALLCTAGYSRHQFVWPCLSQTQQDVIDGLEAAWGFFRGVYPVVVSDNLKAVVEVPDLVSPKFNASFLEYMQARDIQVDPARKKQPQDKARVERQVQYVRNDFFKGEKFGDVEEARREAERWSREDAGMRPHGTTRRPPREVFEAEEQPLLRPAPTEAYDVPRWTTLQSGRDHAVVADQALYSVPYTLGEVELQVRIDRTTVKLYRGAQLVKVHPRQPRGGAHIDPQDLPPGKAELATRDSASLQRQAAAFGPAVGTYARKLLEGPLPWSRMRHVYRLLGLARRYGGPCVGEACARALEMEVIDVTRIERMVERGLSGRAGAAPPPPPPRDNVVPLRFARHPAEYRARRPPPEGGSDAPA